MADDHGSSATDIDDDGDDGADALGDPGKQALDRMKRERDAARKDARETAALRKQLADYEAKNKTEHEKALDKARDEARAEATAEAMKTANERILRAAVREAAAGKLANPADAAAFLDLSDFSVDGNGDVDTKALGKAIDGLLADRPYLAGDGGQRNTGSSDQGVRGGSAEPLKGGKAMDALIRQRAGY